MVDGVEVAEPVEGEPVAAPPVDDPDEPPPDDPPLELPPDEPCATAATEKRSAPERAVETMKARMILPRAA
jgi:hypothetical protein